MKDSRSQTTKLPFVLCSHQRNFFYAVYWSVIFFRSLFSVNVFLSFVLKATMEWRNNFSFSSKCYKLLWRGLYGLYAYREVIGCFGFELNKFIMETVQNEMDIFIIHYIAYYCRQIFSGWFPWDVVIAQKNEINFSHLTTCVEYSLYKW